MHGGLGNFIPDRGSGGGVMGRQVVCGVMLVESASMAVVVSVTPDVTL